MTAPVSPGMSAHGCMGGLEMSESWVSCLCGHLYSVLDVVQHISRNVLYLEYEQIGHSIGCLKCVHNSSSLMKSFHIFIFLIMFQNYRNSEAPLTCVLKLFLKSCFVLIWDLTQGFNRQQACKLGH